VSQRDQSVRLAAAIVGIEPEDRGNLVLIAAQAKADIPE
jgi:hypothetical protein